METGEFIRIQMRKNALLILAVGMYGSLAAQLPRGDRQLSWQVDETETNNYDSAFAYALTGCGESTHLAFLWSSLEPDTGSFDANFVGLLDVMDIYYPAFNTSVELQLAPVNTNVLELPNELSSLSFSDPLVINGYKRLLDTVFAHIPNVTLAALNIGNEQNSYFSTDASKYVDYKVFLNAVVPYAKQLYFNIHGEALKVGTTFTFSGLTNPAISSLCQMVNTGLDIVSTTYYPLDVDFTMRPPSSPIQDFADLVVLYPDTSQPIYFAECGYSSSPVCNSSEIQQAQFYESVFQAWDDQYDHIKYLTIFKTSDWSQTDVDSFAVYFGINDPIFKEYLRTLGVRTWPGNGQNKVAYGQILCELDARGWCSTTNCLVNSIAEAAASETFTVFPNPTTGVVNISGIEDLPKIEQMQIRDTQGRLVHESSNLRYTSGVNVAHLHSGYYHMTLISNTGRSYGSSFMLVD